MIEIVLRNKALGRLYQRLHEAEWVENDSDGEPVLDCKVGQIAITIYTKRVPVEWSIVVLALDAGTTDPQFRVSGQALSVGSAKTHAIPCAVNLADRSIRYLIGESLPGR
jgi:hypothetical protein